jgi:hypothetical protein
MYGRSSEDLPLFPNAANHRKVSMNDYKTSKLYNLQGAARELGEISPWSLRKHIYAGNVRCVRLGRRVLVPADEIARIQRGGLPSLTPASVAGRRRDAATPPIAESSSVSGIDGPAGQPLIQGDEK